MKRKGQTTILAELRAKHGIEEGSRVIVMETEEGILFKRAMTTADLAGSGSSHSSRGDERAARQAQGRRLF